MIASKNQLVQLRAHLRHLCQSTPAGHAKVMSLVYVDRPEGERGVQLDKALGGSKWWSEQDLEPATETKTQN